MYSWLWKSSKTRQQYLSLLKIWDEHGYSYEWINGQKTTSHWRRDSDKLQYGKLRSYRGSRLVKFVLRIFIDSKTPTTQYSSSPSSTSSSSPTVSGIQSREQEYGINSDTSPVHVSTTVDGRSGQPDEIQANKNPKPNKKETTIERWNPSDSEIPEWLHEFRENLVDDEIPVHGDSHATSAVRIFVSTVFILMSPKTDIARSARGPKLQEPRAEDAMAESYLVPINLVTWQQQITKS